MLTDLMKTLSAMAVALAVAAPAAAEDVPIDRTVLPIREPTYPPITELDARNAKAPGKATVRFEFAYDGGGAGKGGLPTILVNGQKVGEGRIDQTQCCMFSLDEAADVGRNDGTPVTEDYKVPFAFNGTIEKVTISLGENAQAEHSSAESIRQENRAKRILAD